MKRLLLAATLLTAAPAFAEPPYYVLMLDNGAKQIKFFCVEATDTPMLELKGELTQGAEDNGQDTKWFPVQGSKGYIGIAGDMAVGLFYSKKACTGAGAGFLKEGYSLAGDGTKS